MTINITVSFISGEPKGRIYRSFVSFVCHQLTETFFKELTSELLHLNFFSSKTEIFDNRAQQSNRRLKQRCVVCMLTLQSEILDEKHLTLPSRFEKKYFVSLSWDFRSLSVRKKYKCHTVQNCSNLVVSKSKANEFDKISGKLKISLIPLKISMSAVKQLKVVILALEFDCYCSGLSRT